MIKVERYTPSMASLWNATVEASRNGTFLHNRAYMDYHADRFDDFSLVARGHGGNIIAVLPADRRNNVLRSHAGLTYGGWLMSPRADIEAMTEVWEQSRRLAIDAGIDTLVYKPVPHIFHRYPAEEDLYVLFRDHAVTSAVGLSSAIDMQCPLPFDQNARRACKRAQAEGLTVRATDDYAGFWSILSDVLALRHNTRPVHTPDEIKLLASRFPDNIRLYGVYRGSQMIAGTVLYITPTTIHAQYIASDEDGRNNGALAFQFAHLIGLYSGTTRYFDFGVSTEDGGKILNNGLARQKSGFGARAIAFNTYTVKWP